MIPRAASSSLRIELNRTFRRSLATPRKKAALFVVIFLLSMQVAGRTQGTTPPLNFFTNYFVTGDYAVASVGTRVGDGTLPGDEDGVVDGFVTKTLNMSAVPPNAIIVSAFIYWQTIVTTNQGSGTDGVKFRGQDITVPIDGIPFVSAKLLNPAGTTPCWSNGGAAGPADGSHNLLSYRLDVLRYLPREKELVNGAHTGPATGRRLVNNQDLLDNQYPLTKVRLPGSGLGNQVPVTSGVSMVVIYRDPSPTAKFRSIVIYDGGYSLDQQHEDMTLTVEGFYQATANAEAKMTQIVGDGQGGNFSERVLFNGVPLAGQTPNSGPFVGSAGERWDGLTFNVSLAENDSSGVVRVDHGDPEFTPYDCLSWSGIIFSTNVKDTDEDGLLDIWETDANLTDPNGYPLPNLTGIADPLQKDMFFQIDYMSSLVAEGGPGDYSTLAEGTVSAHRHLPDYGALKMMADSFKNATDVKNPTAACGNGPGKLQCGPTGVRVHYDVGPFYHTSNLVENGTTYNPSSDGYVMPLNRSKGGNAIAETKECDANTTSCEFPGYFGVTGWKTGFLNIRDQPSNYQTLEQCLANEPGGLNWDEPGEVAALPCQRRFDRARLPMYRYVLWAHFLGRARADVDDPNTPFDETKTPKTNSGIADFPGGDVLMTMGGFVDVRFNGNIPFNTYNGSTVAQASTFMHETGHNLWLRHGDDIGEPNCKPNNLTVMNYLYQLAALINNNGDPAVDYAKQPLPALNESSLNEATGLGNTLYRPRWYAYRYTILNSHDGSQADQTANTTPAKKHCDGKTPLSFAEQDPGLNTPDSPDERELMPWSVLKVRPSLLRLIGMATIKVRTTTLLLLRTSASTGLRRHSLLQRKSGIRSIYNNWRADEMRLML